MSELEDIERRSGWIAKLRGSVPWMPYTHKRRLYLTACEETGHRATNDGRCPYHGGDACLAVYRHPDAGREWA